MRYGIPGRIHITHRISSANRSETCPDHGKQTRTKVVAAKEADARHLHQTQDAWICKGEENTHHEAHASPHRSR